MNLRGKKGSIAIFVLVALLFMASFLIIMFSGNINKSKVVKEQIDIIKDIYGKNTDEDSINEIYNGSTSIITIKKSDTGSFMGIEIESNTEIKKIIFKIDGIEYTSEEEFYEHINDENKVADGEEKEITIKVESESGKVTEITETIKFVKPTIKELPNPIWVNATTVDDSYVVYNNTEVAEETYKIVEVPEETFYTMPEVVNYAYNWLVTNNQNEVTVNIQIMGKGKNNLSSESRQTITFKKPLEPVIGVIPSQIITNITSVSDSYVTYDDKGKREETYTITLKINDTNITFSGSTMSDAVSTVDRWLLENNNRPYEVNADVKIVATGVTNLSSESTQNIKFIRGVKVANETEFTTALASTSPSYIQLENDIASSNTISVDGVTHKLDLNNQNISYTLSSTASEATYTFITLGSNTNLTVIDSSSEKQGSIVAEISEEAASDDINREATVISINNRGELNIESGKIGAKVSRIITEGDKGLGVHDTGAGIKNSGTINLKGGTVYSDVVTQAFGKGAVQISEATAIGIENSGIINSTSGNIDAKAEARYLKNGGVYGRKFAYAYDIVNPSGTINNSENITFTYSAIAVNDNTVFEAKTRSGEIVTEIKKYT